MLTIGDFNSFGVFLGHPVCVTSCLGKLFCSFLNIRLLEFVEQEIYFIRHKLVFYLEIELLTIYSHSRHQ